MYNYSRLDIFLKGAYGKVNVSDMCRHVGISRQQLYNIALEKCEPSVYVAIKISNYLGVDVDKIFQVIEDD